MAINIETVLEKIRDRVLEIPSTPYQHGSYAENWHEATSPYAATDDPDWVKHLAFIVVWADSPVSGMNRDAPGDYLQSATEVEVQFAYRLRAESQQADLRSCAAAARDVVRAINDPASWAPGEVNVEVLNGGTPAIFPTMDFVLVRTAFRILHDYGV